MSEPESELTRALSSNGNFDAERAERDAGEASDAFDAQLKRQARITYACLILVTAVLEFALVGFVLTFSTKAIVGFAVLLVVTVVVIGILAVQHEAANTRISLLREIKLLRLEYAGAPTHPPRTPTRQTAATSTSPWRIVSARETAAWFLVLLVVAAASNFVTVRLMTWGVATTEESRVTLSRDGSGVAVNEVSYRYQGFRPLTSASLWSGDPSYAITQWLDGQGRDLPVHVSAVDGNRRFTVQFAEPVLPGDHVRYTTTAKRPAMAAENEGIWTYHGGRKLGGKGRKYFLEVVRLPQGAQIISANPKPNDQYVEDGCPVARFQAVVDKDHELKYAIEYRVAKENGREVKPAAGD